jgi:hypothetical protein
LPGLGGVFGKIGFLPNASTSKMLLSQPKPWGYTGFSGSLNGKSWKMSGTPERLGVMFEDVDYHLNGG